MWLDVVKYTVADELVFLLFIAYHLVEKACNSIMTYRMGRKYLSA